jgi:hypothetical protein
MRLPAQWSARLRLQIKVHAAAMHAHEVRSTNRTFEFEEFLCRVCLRLPAREDKATCCMWKSMRERIKQHQISHSRRLGIHEGGIATDPQYLERLTGASRHGWERLEVAAQGWGHTKMKRKLASVPT